MDQDKLKDLYHYDEQFRDSIATVDEKGKRIWVYPKKPKGRYHNKRVIVSVVLLAILFAGPFIKIGGEPFLLLNIFERKFSILGMVFWPQDFFILALIAISFFVFIILFTVVFGRVWCGWACPQTLFMEMVFRKIEYWIDGDAGAQRKLAKMPWNAEKIRKRVLKHSIFALIAILIGHTAMAYLIGIEQVKEIVSQPPTENLAGFIGLVAFSGVFYAVFAFLREQACVAICPYGRLQGVLLVKDSMAVMYDWLRGEPRGRMKRNEERSDKGDCIDCKMCVHVCPTGIDIRNGTQLECVNCTACIDACDDVMLKIGKDTGLIRPTSHTAIEAGQQRIFTPRVAGYSGVLALLLTLVIVFVSGRADVEATMLRMPGLIFQKLDDGQIQNIYNVQFVNKTAEDLTLEIRVSNFPEATIEKVGEGAILLDAKSKSDGVYIIKIPEDALEERKTQLRLELISNGEVIDVIKTNFLGPIKF
ncbi:cytochrome c oxidase accessory protein CcoG [Roseivirga pacifica]|uniref:cytochrome c oxidase accessory protein CcoG n=1 Tax=Roseivirga pacifica TaxID=1267423 RepID=UPI0020953D51|nr:cytochrome c oxidase accessory protein CcoG [Roseivirga pacifica]MCO6357753.1 cytochrome c oxidase accessory protein CcoG [Roseivirga pacifica]MCO6366006.1 cytochrome c oxidase accessory protein CcoG [Roseivirga pacifica]MCO6371334.1 cytochrome c oxidase accessory protein CcoG [Roseivirga pacifica]MCO6375495.1 cytochrome c oxidase accessory protein CcoG [Roseivirga pacifica]MCO6378712.1 cytochrome c oxidase accessory protein CcoG [Roseivirga pacifica]